MRRVAAMVGAAAFLIASTAVFAQNAKFNGKWTLDQEKTTAANPAPAGGAAAGGGGGRGGAGGGGGRGGGAMGGGGATFTLTADATSLKRESEGPNGPMTTTYKLDGSKQEMPAGGRGGPSTYVGKWDGSNIVIETTRTGQDGTATVSKQTYSIDSDWLVIAQQTGENPARKTYYKKG